jgi:fibronectin-binding autotransporter adhesin
VIKTGPGTQTLGSTGDSYSGGTTVNQGTLIVSGSLSGSGPARVTAGTLGGGGSIAGAVTIGSGAVLDPGVGLGTAGTKLTLGSSVTLGSSASLVLNLDATAGLSDSLAVSGGLSLDPGDTDTLTLNLLNIPANPGPTTYVLATYNSADPIGAAHFGTVNELGGSLAGSVHYDVPGGAGIDEITFTVVPEPGTWASLLGGLGFLVVWRRSRHRSKSGF